MKIFRIISMMLALVVFQGNAFAQLAGLIGTAVNVCFEEEGKEKAKEVRDIINKLISELIETTKTKINDSNTELTEKTKLEEKLREYEVIKETLEKTPLEKITAEIMQKTYSEENGTREFTEGMQFFLDNFDENFRSKETRFTEVERIETYAVKLTSLVLENRAEVEERLIEEMKKLTEPKVFNELTISVINNMVEEGRMELTFDISDKIRVRDYQTRDIVTFEEYKRTKLGEDALVSEHGVRFSRDYARSLGINGDVFRAEDVAREFVRVKRVKEHR